MLLPSGHQAVAHSLNLETTALLGPHIMLPYGHQAVAHCFNYGTTNLLPAFCAPYAVAHWPPSCGPQPQFFWDYCTPARVLCLICCCPLATKLWPTASIWRLLLSLGLIYCCPMANKLWPTASIWGLLLSYRLFERHMLLPTGHPAVAHSLNYLGTTALLPGFCASYNVALWPPSCGPQPQLGDY